MLHPSKAPKGWRTPEKKINGRSRERDRGRRTGRDDRSQTRSGDRRGEPSKHGRRDQTPHNSRDRVERIQRRDRKPVSEDDSDQERKELERQIEKLKEKVEKKNSRTSRVRADIFSEEDSYMDLQREWNNTRPSKESRDRYRQVRRIKSDTCSPPTRRAPGVRPRESFGWEGHKNYSSYSSVKKIRQVKEAVGSKRSKIDLSDTDEDEDYVDLSDTDEEGDYVPGLHPKMIGYGDF